MKPRNGSLPADFPLKLKLKSSKTPPGVEVAATGALTLEEEEVRDVNFAQESLIKVTQVGELSNLGDFLSTSRTLPATRGCS
jgi:hypothetical protein